MLCAHLEFGGEGTFNWLSHAVTTSDVDVSIQAIILLFARKHTKSSANDGTDDEDLSDDEDEEASNPANAGVDDELEESDTEATDDNTKLTTGNDDDEYDVDPDREAADEEDIDNIIKEVASEHNLGDADRTAGAFAVTKVCSI